MDAVLILLLYNKPPHPGLNACLGRIIDYKEIIGEKHFLWGAFTLYIYNKGIRFSKRISEIKVCGFFFEF